MTESTQAASVASGKGPSRKGDGAAQRAVGPIAAFHQYVRENGRIWYCYACDFAVRGQDCPYNLMWRNRIGLPTSVANAEQQPPKAGPPKQAGASEIQGGTNS